MSVNDARAIEKVESTLRFEESLGRHEGGIPWAYEYEDVCKILTQVPSPENALIALLREPLTENHTVD